MPVPARAVEDEAGVVAQPLGHARERGFGIVAELGEREARLRQQLPLLRRARHLAPCRRGLPGPEQPVEPLGVILGAEHFGIAVEDGLLVIGTEIGREPHLPDERDRGLALPGADEDTRQAQLSLGRQRPVRREIGADHGVRDIVHDLLRMLAEQAELGPVLVLLGEGDDIGKARGVAAHELEPQQDLGREPLARARGKLLGRGPARRARRGKRRAIGLLIPGREQVGGGAVRSAQQDDGSKKATQKRHGRQA